MFTEYGVRIGSGLLITTVVLAAMWIGPETIINWLSGRNSHPALTVLNARRIAAHRKTSSWLTINRLHLIGIRLIKFLLNTVHQEFAVNLTLRINDQDTKINIIIANGIVKMNHQVPLVTWSILITASLGNSGL